MGRDWEVGLHNGKISFISQKIQLI